jgi:ribonuclease VapC
VTARLVVADTSALIAILLGEPERDRFVNLLAEADDPLISAATLVEASIVMLAKTGTDGVGDLDDLLAATNRPLLFKGEDFEHTDISLPRA